MRDSFTKERRLARSIRVKEYWAKKKQEEQDNAD